MPFEFGFSLLPFWVFRNSHLQTHEGICLSGKYVFRVDFSRQLSADVHMCAHFLPSKIIFFGCGHMVSNSWNSYSGRRLSSGIRGTNLAPSVKSESARMY